MKDKLLVDWGSILLENNFHKIELTFLYQVWTILTSSLNMFHSMNNQEDPMIKCMVKLFSTKTCPNDLWAFEDWIKVQVRGT